ncbi:MAG: radical SAM protein [Thermodesulfobacteriota bacterium]
MPTYKPSRFIVEVPINDGSPGKPSLVALYQTITQSFILMDKEEWAAIVQSPGSEPDPETIAMLRDEGLLVDTGVDEAAVFGCWQQQQVHDFSNMTSKIIVTRKCNNRCVYCIIDPEAKEMSHKTAWMMDEYYIRTMRERRPLRVRDDYLGGEPLLRPEIIHASAARRHHFCRQHDIDYGFTVTTNGTMLTPAIISRLLDTGLNNIRVSLAGPARVHDRLRPSKTGRGTYEAIITNLRTVSGLVPITIECQYDSGCRDYETFPEMLDDFARYHLEIENVYFTPIIKKRGKSEYSCGMGDPRIALELRNTAEEYGYASERQAPSSLCRADFRAMFVFDTDGSIIPCPGLQNGEMAYGHVEHGVNFIAESQLLKRCLPSTCLEKCPLLPLCMGGCRLQALTIDNDFAGVDCQYEALAVFLEDYVRHMAEKANEAEPEALAEHVA